MNLDFDVSKIEGFEWDKGNVEKNKKKHNVNPEECEQIFFNMPLILFNDEKHSGKEERFGALGKTDKGRKLAIFFTLRKNKIRVISARNQGKGDRVTYDGEEQKILKKVR